MNKLDFLKGGVELLTSIGVGSIVGNAIKMTTDPNAGRLKKIAIGFGGFVLSSMTSELATKYTNEKIDDIAEKIQTIIKSRAVVEISKDGVDVDILEANEEAFRRELEDPELKITNNKNNKNTKKDEDSE
jgi:hypothetical protein